MRPLPRIAAVAFMVLLLAVRGNPPAWWLEGKCPVIDPTAGSNNSGPANIGQAKWMAMRALETLDTLAPALAAGIRAKLTLPQPKPADPGQSDPAILDFEIPQPLPADWPARQHAPLLIGQLKAMAAPFYDRLHAAAPDWLDHESADPATQGQLQLNGTKDPNDPANFYPWSAAPGDDRNHAPATIGQLKAVFSLRFETIDADQDGLGDLWEMRYFSNLDQSGNGDPDHDGLTNLQEFAMGTNPTVAEIDADSDGLPDNWELAHAGTFAVYPPLLDAALYRSQSAEAPVLLSNDTNAPVNYTITLSGNTGPGYSFLDSVTGGVPFVWEEIRSTGTRLAEISNADDLSQPVNIAGFTFPFGGLAFSQLHVSSNGLLTFGEGRTDYNNNSLPSSFPMPALIAALWDDLDTSTTGDIYYMEKSDRLIVQYQDVGRLWDTGTYTFQVVLFADGRIHLRYHTLTGITNSCTVGIQDATQTLALQMTCNAAYLTNQMAIEIRPESAFFKVAPLTGSIPAYSVAKVTGVFQSLMLPPATYDATMSIAHDGGGITPQPLNARLRVLDHPATVALVNPLAGGTMLQGHYLELRATAEDADGLARIEFHDGALMLGSSNGPYFSFYIYPEPGPHSFVAHAIDVFGTTTASAPVMFTILVDTDQDGMPDDWETAHGLNPTDPTDAGQDPDHDGYTNREEYQNSTNPHVAEDTDGDGMPDGWEFHHGLNPTIDDSHLDLDGDGLTNLTEYQLGTKPNDPDSDADGLPDAWEVLYHLNPNSAYGDDGNTGDPDADGVTNFVEWQYGSNPRNPDTDGDSSNDGAEIAQGSNANDASDNGTPPPAAQMVPVTFRVGDPSGSLSETWNMRITGQGPQDYRTISVASPSYGEMGEMSLQLRRNNRYEITLEHLRTDPWQLEYNWSPDYDWEAQIDGQPQTPVLQYSATQTNPGSYFMVQNHWLVDNMDGLLGVVDQSFDSTNFTTSKKALLLPISIAVDANRDGVIAFDEKDQTSAEKPYRFWVNDNQDEAQENKMFGDFIPETIPPKNPDNMDLEIKSTRDLQDFSRLRIRTTLPDDKLLSGEFRIGFKWMDLPPNVIGSNFPSIRLFEHVEKDGELQYLKNPLVAQRQFEDKNTALADISGAYPMRILAAVGFQRTADFTIPNTLWAGTTESQTSTLHLLFEGAAEGRARLAVVIMDKDGNLIGEGPSVWMDIKNIERMYMRAYTNPAINDFRDPYTIFKDNEPIPPAPYSYKYVPDATNAGPTSPRGQYGVDIDPSQIRWMPGYNDGKLYLPFEPDPDEEKKCVVFVHGVNMSLDEIRAYTAAFYKRLWWEGYKGRLAVFCWPTKLNTGPGPDILYTDIFNTSEFRAWTAGSALKKFVESLKDILGNDGVIGIAAHSLGNACAGSALRQGLVIDNYVMLEAALSTSCLYGPAMPGEPDLLAGHFHKSLANADGSDINKPSPYDCNDLGYRGYLMDLKNGVKNRITNYHNDEDFWLATGSLRHEFPSLDRVQVDWVCNQAKYKPNGEKSYSFYPVHEPTQGGAVYGRPVVSAHESMSFISKSRTRPLGSEPPSSAGGIPVPPFDPRYCFSVDLKNTYNFTDARSNHSGQFLMEIYQLYYNPKISAPFKVPFYLKLMDDLGVLPEP